MAKEQHLTYFKVENFKRFDSLELTDIGQFNLIVGDNNVGKTSLLEALLFEKDRFKFFINYHRVLIERGIKIQPTFRIDSTGKIVSREEPSKPFWNYLINESKPFKIEFLENFENAPIGFLIFKISKDIIEFHNLEKEEGHVRIGSTFAGLGYAFSFKQAGYLSHSGFEFGTQFYGHFDSTMMNQALPFISLSESLDKKLVDHYSNEIGSSRSKKKEFIQKLKVFIPNIDDTGIGKIGDDEHLMIGLPNQDELQPIATFGEGTIRAAKIILEISKWKGQRLMIDEIDTGIHHSRMKEFLKTVFKVAELNDVQLFMTTHSLECQQAFVDVFEDPEMFGFQKDARQFSLIETPEKQVVASGRNFEQLQHSLEIGFDTRGGKRGW